MLSKLPESVYDRLYGLTALHLSVHWATGTRLLLENGGQSLIEEECTIWSLSHTPLQLAIQLDCVETLRVLVQYGAKCTNIRRLPEIWLTGRIIRCVAETMASRRRQLRDLARESLTAEEWLQFEPVKQGRVSDAEAALFCHLIEKNGLQVPGFLSVPPDYEGIFLSGDLDLAHFPIFFEEGFHDINRRNSRGLLPLTVAYKMYSGVTDKTEELSLDEFETFQWLLAHSCLDYHQTDPLLRGMNTSAFGWHLMIEKLWSDYRNWDDPSTSVSAFGNWSRNRGQKDPMVKTREACLLATVEDSCNCPCSTSGCRPFHIWLKLQAEYHYHIPLHRLPQQLGKDLPLVFLRFITFEALNIPHTCCNMTRTWEGPNSDFQCRVLMNFPGDVQEILDEHQHDIEKLETLMVDFRNFLEASADGDLHSFISQYWRQRMAEECIPLEDDLETLKDAGIKVDRRRTFRLLLQS